VASPAAALAVSPLGLGACFSDGMASGWMSRGSPHRRHRRDRHLVAAVVVSFIMMVACFVVSRTTTEIQSRRIQRDANSISQNALKAAEDLIAVRTRLRDLVFTLNALAADDHPHPELASRLGSELAVSRDNLAASWAHYLSIPFYPGEYALIEEVEPDLIGVERGVDETLERLHHDDPRGALRAGALRVLPLIARADTGVGRNLELNRREAETAALRITASTRRRGLWPELVGALFAIAAAYFGVRVLVRYLDWAAERSAELERFAGRVAHDIRSPLGSASLTLALVKQRTDVDPKTQELLARVARAMDHVRQLVDDLLVFATTGGYFVGQAGEEAGERRANVLEVLDGVVDDAEIEARRREIVLVYERPEPLFVACGPGVLISVASNLVSNAMKFMGEAKVRRVTICARRVRDDVHLEVADTGLGLAPELREKIFLPHVRGPSSEPGFGLGLATVKTLAVAHHGAVGVEPSPEGGCRFWVDLPIWSEVHERRSPIRRSHL
jgi:signal transduction histidine kinase